MESKFENSFSIPAQSPELLAILHDSDNSFKFFFHALSLSLSLSLSLKSYLEILDTRTESEIVEHICVRALLEQWGKSKSENVYSFSSIKIKRIVSKGDRIRAIADRIKNKRYDLVVTGSGLKNGIWN